MKIILGSAAVSFLAILSVCIGLFCFKYISTKNDRDIEACIKSQKDFNARRYTYSNVKKMTNNFQTELGQGGYGVVYKGKLGNDLPVAVKILKASDGKGKDFINEVSAITKTSHENVITLLGYCCEGRKQALIFDFMSNGSLDKFINNEGHGPTSSLTWEIRFKISMGIAQGLHYLHTGCRYRIFHFDIKPQNILLDDKFIPKISDFGTAKLSLEKESIVMISSRKGTREYMAPEWDCHANIEISPKSDVYSFGKLILEMVIGRKNFHPSGATFPNWIYNRLEVGGELRPVEDITSENNEIERRLTIVGLWCIQKNASDRPTMDTVIQMLHADINTLQPPPKPQSSFPIRPLPESLTSSDSTGRTDMGGTNNRLQRDL